MHALRQLLGFRVRDRVKVVELWVRYTPTWYTTAEGKLCVGRFTVPWVSLVMTVFML